MCYPDIESFFHNEYSNFNKLNGNNSNHLNESINSNNSSSKKENNNYEFYYPYGGRKHFFEKLKENISMSWPTSNNWNYKNKYKIYGTVQLDSIIYGNFYLNKIGEYYSYIVDQLFLNEPQL